MTSSKFTLCFNIPLKFVLSNFVGQTVLTDIFFSLHSIRRLSKVLLNSPKKDGRRFLTSRKRILKKKKNQGQKDTNTIAAAAQARQEGLVHSVTHRGKGIDVTKIRREPTGHEGNKERMI